jgi:hypothetical protein
VGACGGCEAGGGPLAHTCSSRILASTAALLDTCLPKLYCLPAGTTWPMRATSTALPAAPTAATSACCCGTSRWAGAALPKPPQLRLLNADSWPAHKAAPQPAAVILVEVTCVLACPPGPQVSTLLLAPICPHTCEHVWSNLLQREGLVVNGEGSAVCWPAAASSGTATGQSAEALACCILPGFQLENPHALCSRVCVQPAGRWRMPPTTCCSLLPSEWRQSESMDAPLPWPPPLSLGQPTKQA